jgi:sialate O-acetylesterase
MKSTAARLLLLLAATCCGSGLRADVVLAPLFTDHAVLQRRAAVPVWGTASSGERVTVTFRAHKQAATADAAGRWEVRLPAMEAGEPGELTITGNNRVVLTDVVVGEVWLCGGQSNMAFRVEELEQPAVMAAALNPNIRHFAVGFSAAAEPLTTAKGSWVPCTPDTVGKFTGTGYFFAKDLQARLGVPVGLVNSSVGGTQIESWMSRESLASDPAFAVVNARWAEVMVGYPQARADYEAALKWWENASGKERLESAKQNRRKPTPPRNSAHRDAPASLFNAMVNPIVPYAVRGMLFDQGAANETRTDEYGALFKALITDWRARWAAPALPFYFVQAPNYKDPNSPGDYRAKLREAQAEALALPGTEMAVTIDIGTSDDPHPHNKAEVGRRFSLLARAAIYGEAVTASGPVLQGLDSAGPALRVKFKTFGHRLVARAEPLAGFEVAGVDGRFVPAQARIDGDTVVLTAAEVPAPVAVRYAWGDDPACGLQSDAGLPAWPFRADVRRGIANPG